jgi:single-strand DNA-binding protein
MNKVILVGGVGSDAELKVLANGSAVCKFSIATNEKWVDKAGVKQEKTTWHRCNLWGTRAEKIAQYITKGSKLLVEGSIDNGSFEKEGVKHNTSDIKVSNVEFLGGSKPGGQSAGADPDGLPPAGDEEPPF